MKHSAANEAGQCGMGLDRHDLVTAAVEERKNKFWWKSSCQCRNDLVDLTISTGRDQFVVKLRKLKLLGLSICMASSKALLGACMS